MGMGQFITVRELAAKLGCCTKTIRRRIKAGQLPNPQTVLGHLCWIEGQFDGLPPMEAPRDVPQMLEDQWPYMPPKIDARPPVC